MFDALRTKLSQGRQYILDVRRAAPHGLVGRPVVSLKACDDACSKCQDVCPTGAISLSPVRIDLGKCIFCGECATACPPDTIRFTSETAMASTTREGLDIKRGDATPAPIEVSTALKRMFGRSLRLRSVSAGGCNGCELELNALANVNFDFGRFGIEWVASPRHADALVLSGPLTANMANAIGLAYAAMPDPKFVIAFGACAISGGLYADSDALDRTFLDRFKPALYVPGCPPHPLTFLNGLLDLLGISLPPRPRQKPPTPHDPSLISADTLAARRDTAERLVRTVGCDWGLDREKPKPDEAG